MNKQPSEVDRLKGQVSEDGSIVSKLGPISQNGRLDSAADQQLQQKTPSGSPLLKNKPLIESRQLNQLPMNPSSTPFMRGQNSIKSPTIFKSQPFLETVPYEKYHRNGNVSLHNLKLPEQQTFSHQFPKYFFGIIILLFPIGLLLGYLSSSFNKNTFTFVSCWLMIVFYTLALVQQLITQKNGLLQYILSTQETDNWNEQIFVKTVWIIPITIQYGFMIFDDQVGNSILSLFIYLTIPTSIDIFLIIVIVYLIIPVTTKQMFTIKERMNRLIKLQKNIQIPLSYQFMNAVLGVYYHGSEGSIYQGIVASQNYQKFLMEMDDRQSQLLQIARSRNDKLSHEAANFINQLTKKLRDKKENVIKHTRLINPGLSPLDILLIYISFYLNYCIGYPCLIYLALLFQTIDIQILPLAFFLIPIILYIWKILVLSFFSLKQFYDYIYEAKIIILGVSAYRIGALSVQSLGAGYFAQLLVFKYCCKAFCCWLEVYGYYRVLESQRQTYMSYIRGSTIDTKEKQNKFITKNTIDMSTSTHDSKKRMSVFEPQEHEAPSYSKTASNWEHVENIDNIKVLFNIDNRKHQSQNNCSVQLFYNRVNQSMVYYLLCCAKYYTLSQSKLQDGHQQRYLIFQRMNLQTELGIEILLEALFFIITIILYRSTKVSQNFSQQLSNILGVDGMKSICYDFCFGIVVSFLIVANKFEVS
ncbi:hypothetical protein pb186bvf_001462 [Paramecium bursaria]